MFKTGTSSTLFFIRKPCYMTGATLDFFIIATDHDGTVLWSKSYGTASSSEDFRTTVTPTMTYAYGYIYFTGRKTASGNQNIIIGRTDQTGAISCTTTSNLNITQTNNPTASTTCSMGFVNDALSFPSVSNSALNTKIPDVCSTYSVNLGKDTSLCGSFNLTLNAVSAGATSFLWQNGSTTSTINATSAGTYWVTIQGGNCCSASDTIIVSHSNINAAVLNSNPTICSGNSSTLSASGGASYAWNTGATSSSLIISPGSTSTFSVIVSLGGCKDTAYTTITVIPTPSISISGNTTFCSGNATTLTASGGTNYSWSNGSTSTIITVSPVSSTTYSVTSANGSCTGFATVSVTGYTQPVAAVSADMTICSGQNASFTASGGTNYLWSNGNTVATINVSPGSTTTYSVIVSNGGCADTASANITVNPSPSVSISVLGNTTLCIGNATTLTASGASNYSWSNGSTSTTIIVSPSFSTTYSVVTSNGSCASSSSIIITVSPPPIAAVTANTTICSGQNAILTASGGGNYLWNTGHTTSTITITPTSSINYSVIVSIGSCADTANASITVNLSPTALAWNDTTIPVGSSATLSASGGNSYSWNTGEVSTSISVTPPATTTYTVIVTDANGCTGIDSVTVFVLEDDCSGFQQTVFIPNAFTPNADGENDLLKLFYNIKTSCIKDFEFTLFSRWGEKVFQTTDLANSWDGTFKGQKMNEAVFFYYCKVTTIADEKIIKKGNTTLLR